MPKASGGAIPQTPIRKQRNNNFNLLRLIFATMVILSHSSELIDGDNRRELVATIFGTSMTAGIIGVCGFFLLSGFLIVQSWERRPQLLPFLAKRALRIYPAFIVASLVSAFVLPCFFVDFRSYLAAFETGPYLLSLATLESPPLFVQVFSDDSPFPFLNGAMWSLSFELRCYLLAALLGLLLAIRHRMIWLAVTLVLIAFSLFPQLQEPVAPFDGTIWLRSFDWFFRLTSLFFVGGCFYLFRKQIPLRDIGAIVAVAITIGLFSFERTWHLGLLTSGAYVLFWAAHREVPLLDPLKRIPDISYGLYLYGWPVQKLLIEGVPLMEPWIVFVLSMLLATACGLVSWYGVERWFLSLKPKGSIVTGDPPLQRGR